MKTHWIYFLIGCCIGICIPFLVDQSFAYRDRFGVVNLEWGERITLISVSPNDSVRVLLVERSFIDRNFELRVQKRETAWKTIFKSPDEGKPAGSERIVWSSDSSQFVLIGRHFISKEFSNNFKLQNGEILYLLYDLKENRLYCHWFDVPRFNCLPLPPDTLKNSVGFPLL